jgi:hypothetical protein
MWEKLLIVFFLPQNRGGAETRSAQKSMQGVSKNSKEKKDESQVF